MTMTTMTVVSCCRCCCLVSTSLLVILTIWSLAFTASAAAATPKTVRRKTPRCDYTLIVQEFDSSLCPSVVDQFPGGGGSLPPPRTETSSTSAPQDDLPQREFRDSRPIEMAPVTARFHRQGSSPFVNASRSSLHGNTASLLEGVMIKEESKKSMTQTTRDSHLTNALNEMLHRIEELERKLESAISTNDELLREKLTTAKKMAKLEASVRVLDSRISEEHVQLINETLERQDENLTRILGQMDEVAEQRNYWKSVDRKLAGLMLDMTETNMVLSRQDKLFDRIGIKEKTIPVEATSQVRTCSVVEDSPKYRDCEDIYLSGRTKSGVYYIMPMYSSCPIPVYCDMDTPPGGWLVIQRRQDGSVDFNRNWTDYRMGFGSVGQEHWLGLDNIFLLTNQKQYQLRVDLWDFFGTRVHATYGKFRIDGQREEYRMHVANHSGSVLDGLQHHNGIPFSTPDRDQDTYSEYHCAKEWGAGWWFANCWFVILNGQYHNHTQVEYRGISWNEWKNEQLMKTEMKIRPSSII